MRKHYTGEGFLDDKLMSYRNQRVPITSDNPYQVMGEPIGKMRDQMDCENKDLATHINQWGQRLAGIPCSFYERTKQKKTDLRPCVVFLHGGAFIAGSRKVVENPCRLLAQTSHALVVNVEYPLAPEHHLLTITKSIREVIDDLLQQESIPFDRSLVFLSGDSAGANLVLSCILQYPNLQEQHKFKGLLLYYPVVDLSNTQFLWKFDECEIRGNGDPLVDHCMRSLVGIEQQSEKLYVQKDKEMSDPWVSPLYATDVSLFPPMCIIYAEYDYLRFQIEAFIRKLQASQIEVKQIRYDGVNHAFLNLLGSIDQATDAILEGSIFINKRAGKTI